MYRVEIEAMMKAVGKKCLGIVYNETDKLGVFCELKNGILYDYTGHRVNRKINIWGYIAYKDFGKGYLEGYKVKFDN